MITFAGLSSLPGTGLISSLVAKNGTYYLAGLGDTPLLSQTAQGQIRETSTSEPLYGSGSLLALDIGAHGGLLLGNGSIFLLDAMGRPTALGALEHPYALKGATSIKLASGEVMIFAGISNGDGLVQIKLSSSGALLAHTLLPDTGAITARGITATSIVTHQGKTYLLAASETEGGFTSWQIGTDGSLSNARMTSGAWFTEPSEMLSVSFGTTTYILTAGTLSSTLSVHRLETNGGLTQTDFVLDSLDTRFEGASAMATAKIGNDAYIVVAGKDGGFSVLQLLPEGRLIARAHIADTVQMNLRHVTDIVVQVEGQSLIIHTVSSQEAGLGKFIFTPTGQVISTAAGAHLTGTNGDDVLLDSAGASFHTGGAGADLFIMAADGAPDTILDFTLGVDKIDLSAWADLRSILQLDFTKTATGVEIRYKNELLTIHAANGLPIDPQLFQNHDLFNLDHLPPQLAAGAPVDPTPSSHIVYGSGGDDSMSPPVADGGIVYMLEGNDSFWGRAGSDTVYGGPGNDSLQGREGDDFLYGGDGKDTLSGYHGNDVLFGGEGDDWVDGGEGDDWLSGDAGNDTILGAAGNDVLLDGAGEDRLTGGSGRDLFILSYDRQRDVITDFTLGEDLIDLSAWVDLKGLPQLSFVMTGNSLEILYMGEVLVLSNVTFSPSDLRHEDLFAGAPSPPAQPGTSNGLFLTGSNKSEVFHGTNYDDRIDGGAGNDRIFGYAGNDWLMGGDGDDLLDGGTGNDRMEGGAGNDTYHVDSSGDLVLENWNGGYDTVLSWVSFEAGKNVEVVRLQGTASIDASGGVDDNLLVGNSGNNYLRGADGFDWLAGKEGNDILEGGRGRDWLVGGPGADIFRYISVSDSLPGQDQRDLINGFERGLDKIDLSAIDASTRENGNQAFRFIGQFPFNGFAGELRYASWDLGWLIVEGDTNGDAKADFQIFINLLNHIGADDFYL